MGRYINWEGNTGLLESSLNWVQEAICDICGTKMEVERNVERVVSKGLGRCDRFRCKYIGAGWHKKIEILKHHVNRIKKEAEKEINELLNIHVP